MVSREMFPVDPKFAEKVRKIQEEIMGKQKKKISLNEITREIAKDPAMDKVIERLINGEFKGLEINLKFDGRKL